MERIQVRSHQQHGPERCPYCLDDVTSAERVTCAGCNAPYHRECLHEELGGCGIQGCSRPVAGARPDLIRVRLRERELPQVGEELPCASCGTGFRIPVGGRTHTICARCHSRHFLFALAVIAVFMALIVAYVVLVQPLK